MKSMVLLNELVRLKICERKQNRLLFRGCQSLSEVGFLMAAVLDDRHRKRGFLPSSLSRALRGERQFTPQQWEVFCEILELTRYERAALEHVRAQELLASRGFASEIGPSFDFDSFIDLQKDLLDSIIEMWLGGMPKRATALAESALARLRVLLQRRVSRNQREQLLILCSELVYHSGRAVACSSHPLEAFSILKALADQEEWIAGILAQSDSKYEKAFARACHLRGDAYYGMRDWDTARTHYSHGLAHEHDPWAQVELLHGISLANAYCNKDRRFQSDIALMRECVEKGNLGTAEEVVVFEAESRGHALLRREDTWKQSETGMLLLRQVHQQGTPIALRKQQFGRNTIVALIEIERGEANIETLRSEITGNLQFAEDHQYFKYVHDLEFLTRSYVKTYPQFTPLLELFKEEPFGSLGLAV